MSVGPIDFSREPNQDLKEPTEYGGGSGLIDGLGTEPAHSLTTSERRGVLVRAKSYETSEIVVDDDGATTVVITKHSEGIDFHTGLDQSVVLAEDAAADTEPVLPPS